MPINSRAKGAREERAVANWFIEQGFPASRGCQFQGGKDSPDVKCEALGRFHFEVKHVQALNIHNAMEQSVRDGVGKLPVVIHRKNGTGRLVTMRAEDWVVLVKGWVDATK